MKAHRPLAWLLLTIMLVFGWRHWHRLPFFGTPLPPATSQQPTTTQHQAKTTAHTAALPAFLPAEAHATITAIQNGGPFNHHQDGNVFGNYEGHLPRQPRGWYHEYTVETPGARDRGARRIITGGTPPREWYYSDDHYASFRRFTAP